MEKLKEMFKRLNPKHGFIVEDSDDEEGVASLHVTKDGSIGSFLVEPTTVQIKTLLKVSKVPAYRICEVKSSFDSETGLSDFDSHEVMTIRGEGCVIAELAGLFAKNDIESELYWLAEQIAQEEFEKAVGKGDMCNGKV